MRKPLALSVAIVGSAAGFAAASIVAGGGLSAVAAELTGETVTQVQTQTQVQTVTVSTTVLTTTTTTVSGGRRIIICHRNGRHGFRSIAVAQNSLRSHLRHGDRIGFCIVILRGHGHAFGTTGTTTTQPTVPAPTVTSTTTSTPTVTTGDGDNYRDDGGSGPVGHGGFGHRGHH